MELEQDRADEYLSVRKKFKNQKKIVLNQPFKVSEILYSDIHGDIFKLDMKQGVIELKIYTLNSRAEDCFVLCRLDLGEDLVHKNPDGTKIIGNHVHFYTKGFGDKIAKPVGEVGFDEGGSILDFTTKFFEICNIDKSKLSMQELI